MSFNLVDNTNYGMKEGQDKATAKSFPFTSNTTTINANNCTTAGVYLAIVSGGSSNLPSGVTTGLLIVIKSSASGFGNDVFQYFFSTDGTVHYRTYNGSEWSAWG